jgi:hypothetical protein
MHASVAQAKAKHSEHLALSGGATLAGEDRTIYVSSQRSVYLVVDGQKVMA